MKTIPVFNFSKPMPLLISVRSILIECIYSMMFFLVSNDQLRGRTNAEQAQVLQWLQYGEREINPVSATLVYPCMGIMQFHKSNNDRAKEELKQILQVLNQHLRTRTYLVGERITLADIAITCDLLLLFQWVIQKNIYRFLLMCVFFLVIIVDSRTKSS